MRAAILAGALACAAAGCSGGEPAPARQPGAATAAPAASPPAAATPLPPAVDIAGEWRVAGIDGQALDRPYGLALRATANRIWWEPVCAGQERSFRIEGTRFRAALPPPTGEVCHIAVPPEIPQIWEVLAVADTIRRTAENGVMIEGRGRSVLLFSQ